MQLVHNGVARTLKKLRTSSTLKGDYWNKQLFSSIASLHNWNFSKRKEFAPRGSKFFPLRAGPFGMENPLYHIR